MKRLFLAVATIEHSSYMNADPPSESVTRVIWATTVEEAYLLLDGEFTRHDPYGRSTRISGCDISEALGVP